MKYASLALTLVALVVLSPTSAAACFCANPDLSQSIKNARAIFTAKVVEVSRESVVFEVEQVWKGDIAQRFSLNHGGGSCDVSFRKGEAYLVYAHTRKYFLSGEERWYTNECARTRKLSEAVADLSRLREFNLSSIKRGL